MGLLNQYPLFIINISTKPISSNLCSLFISQPNQYPPTSFIIYISTKPIYSNLCSLFISQLNQFPPTSFIIYISTKPISSNLCSLFISQLNQYPPTSIHNYTPHTTKLLGGGVSAEVNGYHFSTFWFHRTVWSPIQARLSVVSYLFCCTSRQCPRCYFKWLQQILWRLSPRRLSINWPSSSRAPKAACQTPIIWST